MDRPGRFARADGGTIFLDEIGELPLPNQVKLLRVLQEGTFEPLGSDQTIQVDLRVVSATNKDLAQMVKEGSFREDLYYRLNLIQLHLPPLRERPGDTRQLAAHFLHNLRQLYDRPALCLSEAALAWLAQQDFPGNIRQLKNLIERVVLIEATDELQPEHLERHYQGRELNSQLPQVGEVSLEQMEVQMIRKAMVYHQGNITEVARALGITRSALYRRLQKYQIPYDT